MLRTDVTITASVIHEGLAAEKSVTVNKHFTEWGTVLGDDVLATAILDRLLHHCDVLAINGPSYRLKDRQGRVTPADPTAS